MSTITRESILGLLARCKNRNCNEIYLPIPGDHSGFCETCGDYYTQKTEADKQAAWHAGMTEGDCI